MNLQLLGKIREQRGLTLTALQERIGVRLQVLAAIERGAFEELPTGLYGRHAVRAYATAIGLSADELLEEVMPLLREAEDPLDGLARVRGFERKSPKVRLKPEMTEARLKRDATNERKPVATGEAIAMARAAAASAIDGALLSVFTIVLLQVTALLSHASLAESAPHAAPAVGTIVAVVATVYFVMLAGLRQATFGQTMAQVRPETLSQDHDLNAIVSRGLDCALREGSILIELYRSRYTRIAPELNATGKSIGCSVTR